LTGTSPKLIDELSALIAKSADYLAEQAAAEARAVLERDAQEREYGIDKANDSIPYFTRSIKNYAERGIRTFDITVQNHSATYEYDIEGQAYADTLIEYFTSQGLDVETKRDTQEPFSGSYYSSKEPRYNSKLILTW
jgi:hypothetical protein